MKSTIGCIIKFFFLTYLEFFLGNVDFSVIHEGEESLDLGDVHAPQVDDGMLVCGVPGQDCPQPGTAGCQHHTVCPHLLLPTGQPDVHQVRESPDVTEGRAAVSTVPLQVEHFFALAAGGHLTLSTLFLNVSFIFFMELTNFSSRAEQL